MNTLFIVVNVDTFFLSHRKEIAIEAKKQGFVVTIIAQDTGKGNEIKSLGLEFMDLPKAKSLQNLLKEFKIFTFLLHVYKKQKPDIVHHVGLKLILYGTLAARFARIKAVVNAVSGLGIFFS
jgi:predicted glycosyltransferase